MSFYMPSDSGEKVEISLILALQLLPSDLWLFSDVISWNIKVSL